MSTVPSYQAAGSTCAWIDRPGTVILMDSPQLAQCAVTTTVVLNFRRSPARGEVIGLIPKGEELPVAAKTPYWYNVRFGGRDGWVSGDFVQPNSHC